MKYRQVTERERYLLAYLKNKGKTVFQIAFALERHRSTIYKRIWKDKREGGRLFKSLRQVSKKRRKRYRAYDSRGVLPGKRHISQRPKEAWDRSEKGHFEGDLMHGKWGKPCILTMVDRMTRLTVIAKLPDKTKRSVNRRLVPIIRTFGIKTITLDNGCEFHGYKAVELETGVRWYFATRHHSCAYFG